MAITNAQQFKQLVNPPMKGKKRPGYRGDAAYGDRSNKDAIGDGPATGPGALGDQGRSDYGQFVRKAKANVKIAPEIERAQARRDLPKNILRQVALSFLPPPIRLGYTAFNLAPKPFQDQIRTALLTGPKTTNDDDDDIPTGGGGEGQDNTGTMMAQAFTPYQQDIVKDEVEELSPIALALRQRDEMGGARAFAKEGGRIGLQEGGGIEQRLEQLGGDVTSAEQMLQGINQRLKTAESSLGGGGVEELQAVRPSGGLAEIANNLDTFPGNPNRPIQLPGIRPDFNATIDPNFKPVEELKAVQPGDPGYRAPGPTTLNGVVIDNPLLTESRERIFNNIPEEYRAGFAEFAKGRPIGFGGQAISYVGLPSGDRVMFGDTGSAGTFRDYLSSIGFTPPGPQVAQLPAQGSLGIPAAGYAKGGPVGGIMDLEQARQGYKLGKLVKKVTKSLKKIVKSPVGAAAVASFLPIFGEKGNRQNLFQKYELGDKLMNFLPEDNKDRLALAAAAGLTAAPLIFGEDDTEDEYQKFLASRGALGQSFDIPGTRAKPYDTLARAFVAEGGKPEPVAKKTMPLLDMGGKEMDFRDNGGFVPIGRMEKADDVPARLSKNEFVFTADAVRNAGDGDVDKGAEVMYNMMKNLEAGGDVSEESQGLEGARKMFQTSQRLEEVL